MPRVVNPTGWSVVTAGGGTRGENGPLVSLVDASGEHRLSIHPLSDRLVRVVRQLPSRLNGIRLRDDSPTGVQWEKRDHTGWTVTHDACAKRLTIKSPTAALTITLEYDLYLRLTWHWHAHPTTRPFLQDFKRAYPYDIISGRVWHYTVSEGYMPSSEHEHDAAVRPSKRKYIYGLGETKGPLEKLGKRYVIDGRDSLAADPEETDPYYKLTPFYLTHDRGNANGDGRGSFWHGIYYNTLNSSIFDFGAEHDFSTGDFHSFATEHGPLDYYVLLGTTQDDAMAPPDLPGIVTQLAHLVTPQQQQRSSSSSPAEWRASPTLPSLSQFGYLASSLTLSERHDAQAAVLEYVREARARRFAIDGMHLSSGYCQDPQTGKRHFFVWNKERYPDPRGMADELERGQEGEHCGVIINVKPWLLESHPLYAEHRGAVFIKAAPDAANDEERAGSHGQSRTWHWSTSMGQTGRGSYFDYSSKEGSEAWKALLRRGVLDVGISGVWIDNNEMSTLIDDADQLAGQRRFWSLSGSEEDDDDEVAVRMSGWQGTSPIGAWGRATLTMGMAQSTCEALLSASPDRRPVIVTRSAVPGMQAFAGATWSGDNSTTWKALRWSTKLTLSYGLSFGIGLYGHDIGGFAGEHSPSADLLVRWCQQAAWSTRFTVHSWKKISTTLWMYDAATTNHLRSILDWRYGLIPMLYSLYVTDYWKRGWPVLRPLLWYHARDTGTLEQDEQFLLGSHVLVAPVLEAGKSTVTFNLPNVVDSSEEVVWWYDVGRGKWIEPAPKGVTGRTVTLDCPPQSPHSPFLVRAGGTLVLAPSGMTSVMKPAASRRVRHVTIFPAPSQAAGEGESCGHFMLIEDDGVSNGATERGEMSEIEISWAVTGPEEVRVGYRLNARGYRGEWKLLVSLPDGDGRRLVSDDGVRDDAGILCLTVTIS